MGIAEGAAILSATTTAYSAIKSDRASVKAENRAKFQETQNAQERERIEAKQAESDKALKASQKKVAASVQRSRASRSAAALFQEAQGASPGPSSTLG
jgi:hypothetical protein